MTIEIIFGTWGKFGIQYGTRTFRIDLGFLAIGFYAADIDYMYREMKKKNILYKKLINKHLKGVTIVEEEASND